MSAVAHADVSCSRRTYDGRSRRQARGERVPAAGYGELQHVFFRCSVLPMLR